MSRVLVTGADGFVGRALASRLAEAGHAVVQVARASSDERVLAIGDIAAYDQWSSYLEGVDAVIHLAGRAHVVRETAGDGMDEFRRVNVEGTLRLARAAATAGVGRFVFVSSIGVNGVRTHDLAFRESDAPNPTEPYAISKWEAEQGLLELGARSRMEITRVRPPLIVGRLAKGNLRRFLQLVDRAAVRIDPQPAQLRGT
jgi:nucleoside-diphosphate-sugar epimerase